MGEAEQASDQHKLNQPLLQGELYEGHIVFYVIKLISLALLNK